jgi:hypothetical protein
MNPLIRTLKPTRIFLVAVVCFGLSPASRAVDPPPDGGYSNQNTAEGDGALLRTHEQHDWRSKYGDRGANEENQLGIDAIEALYQLS